MANVIVLFEVTIKEGKMDDYLNMAASLKTELEHSEELSKADGFISAERFESLSTKGKLLSKSEWKDEESVTKWRNMAKHRMCQKAGREHDFIDYKITVVTPLRCYTMTMRDEAPADANQYFNL